MWKVRDGFVPTSRTIWLRRALSFGLILPLALVLSSIALSANVAFAATGTATISGTVFGANNAPITTGDICVDADLLTSSMSYSTVATATTDGSGHYTITGLGSGDYDVYFYDCSSSSRNDVPQYYVATPGPPYSGTQDFTDASQVSLIGQGAASGIDATLAAGTTISGTVYGGAGTSRPLDQICVAAGGVAPAGGTATTDSAGKYTITHLAPGAPGYDVYFSYCNTPGAYVAQYYNRSGTGNNDASSATPVLPGAATGATGIDVHLVLGGSITGKITDGNGHPITSGVCATADLTPGTGGRYADFGGYFYGNSPNGDYVITGLPAGSYSVSFYTCTGSTRNDLPVQPLTGVSVTSGAMTTANVQIQQASTISGTVDGCTATWLSGGGCTGAETPLAGVCVFGLVPGTSFGYAGDLEGGTQSDGTYTLMAADPAQSYIIEFLPCQASGAGYEQQYFDNVASYSSATPVTATLAAPATGVNAVLALPPGATGGGPTTTTTTPTTTTPTPTPTTPTTSTPTTTPVVPAAAIIPSRAAVRAALAAMRMPKGKGATVADFRKSAGYRLAFVAPSAGQLVVDWYYLPAGARLPRRNAKPELVGSARLTIVQAGNQKITLKLNAAGRRLLAHTHATKLTAYASFTPAGGSLTSVTKNFTP